MNSQQKAYKALKDKMSRNLEQYIQVNTPYTQEETPIILEIINTPELLIAIISRSTEITRIAFENNIPDLKSGLAYVDRYYNATFYMLTDTSDNKSTFMIMQRNEVVMFYETFLEYQP